MENKTNKVYECPDIVAGCEAFRLLGDYYGSRRMLYGKCNEHLTPKMRFPRLKKYFSKPYEIPEDIRVDMWRVMERALTETMAAFIVATDEMQLRLEQMEGRMQLRRPVTATLSEMLVEYEESTKETKNMEEPNNG